MKQKTKDFLFKKRIKTLKSQKGFSLLEVLVAVGIIAIIGAIAYPSFDDYRQDAARTASDTSASNIVKAFRNCRVLKTFGECDTLSEIKMNCPSGATCADEDDGSKFCADIKKGDDLNNPEFSVCVSVNGPDETRTYGGTLITGKHKICQVTQPNDCNTQGERGKTSAGGSIKICSGNPDCTSHTGTLCSGGSSVTTACAEVTTNGTCDTNGDCT